MWQLPSVSSLSQLTFIWTSKKILGYSDFCYGLDNKLTCFVFSRNCSFCKPRCSHISKLTGSWWKVKRPSQRFLRSLSSIPHSERDFRRDLYEKCANRVFHDVCATIRRFWWRIWKEHSRKPNSRYLHFDSTPHRPGDIPPWRLKMVRYLPQEQSVDGVTARSHSILVAPLQQVFPAWLTIQTEDPRSMGRLAHAEGPYLVLWGGNARWLVSTRTWFSADMQCKTCFRTVVFWNLGDVSARIASSMNL